MPLHHNVKHSTLGIDFINKLYPREYTLTPTSPHVKLGFIPDEVAIPLERIKTRYALFNVQDGQNISKDQLIAPMVKALQELSQRLTATEKELALLSSRVVDSDAK